MHAGSCIIFTAILSVIVLKRRLNWLHCTGALLGSAHLRTKKPCTPPIMQMLGLSVAGNPPRMRAGICLTLLAVVIVSLVNIIYPPPPICPPGDPACLQGGLPGQAQPQAGTWDGLTALLAGGGARAPQASSGFMLQSSDATGTC